MATGAAGAAAAIANAAKASGVIVKVSHENFSAILARAERPLVVHATGGLFSTHYKYLTSYKGLAFFTKSAVPLVLPVGAELVKAQSIWIPE